MMQCQKHSSLYMSLILHQTTTEALPDVAGCDLYMSLILHQTTTGLNGISFQVACMSLILHQTTTLRVAVQLIETCICL